MEEATKVAKRVNGMVFYGCQVSAKVVASGWNRRRSLVSKIQSRHEAEHLHKAKISRSAGGEGTGDGVCVLDRAFLGLKMKKDKTVLNFLPNKARLQNVAGVGDVSEASFVQTKKDLEVGGVRSKFSKERKDFFFKFYRHVQFISSKASDERGTFVVNRFIFKQNRVGLVSNLMKLRYVDDIKEGGGKGMESSIGNDGLDISERRSLFQKKSLGCCDGVAFEKWHGRCSLLDIESRMGMGSSADKFSTSSSMSSEDVRVVDSNRPGLCVVGVDLEGPAVDVFINLRGKASMRDERDCSNLCVISISATRRQGGKSFYLSRSLCMKIRSVSESIQT
ncbi:hypothetical protein Q3G72_015129 [Acer saccharum]|nr:hypothetical protein Q3G72_015129 [Acer saccharum]